MQDSIYAQLTDTDSLFACQERFALRHVQGIYPFEQYTCSTGKRLLSDQNLPKWFWWYATPNKKPCADLHHIDMSLPPPHCTELVAGGVVGAIKLRSVSAAVVLELRRKHFPHIYIVSSATQYFVVLQRVAFKRTIPVIWKTDVIRLMTLQPECKQKCLQMLLSEGTHSLTQCHSVTHTVSHYTHNITQCQCVSIILVSISRIYRLDYLIHANLLHSVSLQLEVVLSKTHNVMHTHEDERAYFIYSMSHVQGTWSARRRRRKLLQLATFSIARFWNRGWLLWTYTIYSEVWNALA
jgi:hypothetical protein